MRSQAFWHASPVLTHFEAELGIIFDESSLIPPPTLLSRYACAPRNCITLVSTSKKNISIELILLDRRSPIVSRIFKIKCLRGSTKDLPGEGEGRAVPPSPIKYSTESFLLSLTLQQKNAAFLGIDVKTSQNKLIVQPLWCMFTLPALVLLLIFIHYSPGRRVVAAFFFPLSPEGRMNPVSSTGFRKSFNKWGASTKQKISRLGRYGMTCCTS